MNPNVLFNYTWSKPYLPAVGMEKVYLLIEAKGHAPARTDRAPLNLSLVLDRSGSMGGAPLANSIKACQFVIEQMDPADVLSLVAFDNQVKTVFPPAPVKHKNSMKAAVGAIEPGGSTNLSGGLLEGAQYVRKAVKDGTVNRVILLSDGHANQGITEPARLADIAREFRSSGVGITTMGVGDGFDEELMETIADNGGGNFYFIEQPDDIPAIFDKELQGLLTVVAQNMKLTLQPSDGVRIAGVYGYRAEEVLGETAIAAGDLYHDEVKTVLIELAVRSHVPGQHPLLLLNWDYVDVTEGAAASTFACEVSAMFTNNRDLLNQPADANVLKQVELTESARAIEEAMRALDSGDMQGGQAMLRVQADRLMAMSAELGDDTLAEASTKLYDRLDNFHYSSGTRKTLHEMKYRQMKRK